MKINLATLTLIAALSSAAAAAWASDPMKDMPMDGMPAAGQTKSQSHHATGVVKKIDAKAGVLTIAHGPVKSLGWPAMTMGFLVKDKMLLDKAAVDKAIEFDFQQGSAGYVVTAVK